MSERNLVIGTYNKGCQSFSTIFRQQHKFDLLDVAFGIIGKKRLKTLPIVIVKTQHSAMKLNRLSSLLYGWYKSKVQTMTEAWVANSLVSL